MTIERTLKLDKSSKGAEITTTMKKAPAAKKSKATPTAKKIAKKIEEKAAADAADSGPKSTKAGSKALVGTKRRAESSDKKKPVAKTKKKE